MASSINSSATSKIAIVKYFIPEELGSGPSNVIFELILDRIKAMLTGERFIPNYRKLILTVHPEFMHDSEFPEGEKEKYLNIYEERIKAAFRDVESDTDYISTITMLKDLKPKSFEIGEIAERQIVIRLRH